MNTEFIAAAELKKKYAVFGNFYSRDLNQTTNFTGRNILEIIGHDVCPLMPRDIEGMLPDAIMIMMNPGSSQPLEDIEYQRTLGKQSQIKQNLVATKPDTTQYQVMRIMSYMSWQHVRVINLSDLREAKSLLFIKKFIGLEAEFSYDLHSIFAKKRREELTLALKRKTDAPLIKGWGISDKLDPLIERAELALAELNQNQAQKDVVFGVVKADLTPIKYFHPLPTLQKDKNQWVENIVNQLKFKG